MKSLMRQSTRTEKGALSIIAGVASSAAVPLSFSSDKSSIKEARKANDGSKQTVEDEPKQKQRTHTMSLSERPTTTPLSSSTTRSLDETSSTLSSQDQRSLPADRNFDSIDLGSEIGSLDEILKELHALTQIPSNKRGKVRSLWGRGEQPKRTTKQDSSIDRVINKRQPVFANKLANVPPYIDSLVTDPDNPTEEHGLPEFLVRCIRKIENMGGTVGLYRVNGDTEVVQKIRYENDGRVKF